MLETGRTRYFFTDSHGSVLETIEQFVGEENGEQQEGTGKSVGFRFTDPTGGRRFLTIAVRAETDDSPIGGKITFRWRDEPDGSFVEKANHLEQRLFEQFELLNLAEARQQQE